MARKKEYEEPSYEVLGWEGADRRLLYSSATPDRNVLRITLSGGGRLEIELWERTPGRLSVRGLSSGLSVHGHSSNLFELSVDGR